MKTLIIFACVITAINFWSEIDEFLNPTSDFTASHEQRVVLYATSWCSYCAKMRTFFGQNNIDYFEYDIEKSVEGRRQYDILRGKFIPLVQVDGKVIRSGDTKKILEILM
ncbi:MAG: mycoredoxin [Gammaproteobacteria bacterium]|jgi:mycoredoxin